MESGGIGKDSDAAQQPEGHKKSQKGIAQQAILRIGKNQQDVHRDTAELKRKISPIIGPIVEKKSKTGLFPYFRSKHKESAANKKWTEAEG